jgi:mannitol/fructose-specific phosphotransferase system IIA component (Ntr-type)
MNISRFMRPELIKLGFDYHFEQPEGDDGLSQRILWDVKRAILEELVELLERSDEIRNPSKTLLDLYNRERKATTAIGHGIAVPHVRTIQAKSFVIGFCRSPEGLPFDSLDGEPVHIFIPMVAPPYDDSLYLRVFKAIAELIRYPRFMERLMAADSPHEIIRVVRSFE